MKSSDEREYWASAPSNEISDRILEKVDDYYEYLQISGRLSLYLRSYLYYYRPRTTGGRMAPAGEQGELVAISINQYRNILLHLETLTLQQRPYFEPRATNSDSKSQAQVILAAGLLDYYMREKKLERNIRQSIKDALMFGESYVRVEWDANGGEKYGMTETGAEIKEGDIKYTNFNPLDVVKDYTKSGPGQDDWVILREFKNKFDLAADYPEIAEDILSDSNDDIMVKTTTLIANALSDSDNIAVFTLLHRPTSSMPNGRYTTCLNNGTVLMDGPIPYKETHVYRMAADEESGTPFGYTVGFDLLPIQEAYDMLHSTVLTNQAAFGVQNVLVPKGGDISSSQMSGGLTITEYDPKIGKPEAMNLTSTPAEIFNYQQTLEKLFETISGVNSVARGNPESSLKSGAALALVQSMAIQFSMNLQQSYVQLCEDVGTGTIDILKDFAAVPRVASIAGKSNKPLMPQFTGDNLNSIDRVTVDMGNPLTRTTAGKVNLADSLMERNLIENADQYIQVITTGRLEPVMENKQSQLLLMKSENEFLTEGKPVRALITDNHPKHILEHGIVTNDPALRSDPNNPILIETLNHIQEHWDLWRNMDQGYFHALHPLETPYQGPPSGANGGAADMLNGTPQIQQQAADVNLPNAPTNPLTGDQAQVPQGFQG